MKFVFTMRIRSKSLLFTVCYKKICGEIALFDTMLCAIYTEAVLNGWRGWKSSGHRGCGHHQPHLCGTRVWPALAGLSRLPHPFSRASKQRPDIEMSGLHAWAGWVEQTFALLGLVVQEIVQSFVKLYVSYYVKFVQFFVKLVLFLKSKGPACFLLKVFMTSPCKSPNPFV